MKWSAYILTRATMLVLLMTPASAAYSGWSATFYPDQSTFRVADVVTGRIELRFEVDGRVWNDSAIDAVCQRVSFIVVSPEGVETEMVEASLAEQWRLTPIRLNSGEAVTKPVCLARQDGRFVFDVRGVYKIAASINMADTAGARAQLVRTESVPITVVDAGPVPQAYRDLFARLPVICGCFRYGLSTYSVFQLKDVSFGAYDESVYAFMTYQLWHTDVASRVISPTKEAESLVAAGMSLYESRSEGRPCRGRWLIDALDSMRMANEEKHLKFDDLHLAAGSVLF